MIQRGLQDAESAKSALKNAEAEREAIIQEARKQASMILNDAETSAKKIRETELQKTREQVEKLLESGEMEIKSDREQMIRDAKKEIGALVVLGVDKVVARAAPKIDFEPIVAEAIKEL